MYVGRLMQKDLVTIPPDTSLVEANSIIGEKAISHLLVVDRKEKLLGMISDRDLKQSWASQATTLSVHELNYLLEQVTVDMIMAKTIISIPPDTTIERAAYIMQENRINALPVIQDDTLVGIITTHDVMGVLLLAIGINEDSARFAVLVKDRIGVMAEVTKILMDHRINIRSLFTWPEKKYPGIYQLVMRVNAADGERAMEALTGGGFKVLPKYVQDLEPYLPEG
ncbi:MAG: CBS domain-containing protein [Deltaproteobacteria bacterium]|nr:CBS domain-containing protein [Deltaproteobacteria bacterium]